MMVGIVTMVAIKHLRARYLLTQSFPITKTTSFSGNIYILD